ncbi:tetratricopeptide repeat protein [Rhodomicrobium sp. Az07]|uniref:tetratricopeptide repeat protein n=1 Tax=Rhodomicrobium sp. Az07 TaxID=2839034 RepID=UPI001BEB1FB3|nr:tetratricopeptide repeat protein [Rhodomicrobium sp. Az07]MBT3072077.1 tetratricopeptide repeat protein [Rhodomicrobium sp. Az07]
MRFTALVWSALALAGPVAHAGGTASDQCQGALRKAALAEAVALCSQAVDANPADARSLTHRGGAFLALEDFDRAYEDLARSAALDGGNPLTFYNLGVYYDKTKKPEKAVEAYSTTIRLSPGNPVAYFNRAKAYERLCKSAEALRDYQKIRDIAPGMARARTIPTSVEACSSE